MQPDFNMIIWIDWDLNKIKDHDQTTKTHMERVEDGQKKERDLYHLTNDGIAFFLSYPLQALQIHDDRYLSRYGLQLKQDKFLFTQGKRVRYVLLTRMEDERRRDWITNKLREPVMVLRSPVTKARGGL